MVVGTTVIHLSQRQTLSYEAHFNEMRNASFVELYLHSVIYKIFYQNLQKVLKIYNLSGSLASLRLVPQCFLPPIGVPELVQPSDACSLFSGEAPISGPLRRC